MKLLTMALKDVLVTVRDRKALITLVAMPMVLITILGLALGPVFSEDPKLNRIDVALVDHDRGDVANAFKDTLTAGKLRDVLNVKTMDEEAARGKVENGDLTALIVVPPGFSKRIDDGDRSYVTVLTDPGRPINGQVVKSIVGAISTGISSFQTSVKTSARFIVDRHLFTTKSTKREINAIVDDLVARQRDAGSGKRVSVVTYQAKQEKKVGSLQYYSVAMAVMFVLFSAMFGAFSIITERDKMTLARLFTTPTARFSIVGGKILGTFFLGILQFLILVGSTRLLFGVDWGSSVIGVAGLMLATVFAATGMSVFIATAAKTARAAGGTAQLFIQSMSAFGGSYVPLAMFPPFMRSLSKLSINGWAITGFVGLMEGARLATILPSLEALAAIGIVFFALGVWRLRYE